MTDQPRKFTWEFWLPLIVGVAAIFWFLLIPSWHNVIGHFHAQTWASEKGLVTASKTYTFHAQERKQTGYHFRYKFEVDGVSYESGRYSFRNANGDEPVAVKAHGEGDEITVYYDPQNPSQSVIDRDSSPYWNYIVLLFATLIPIGLLLKWRAIFKRDARQA